MKICEKAEREQASQLKTIAVYGAYFLDPIGQLASASLVFFTPDRVRHEWIVATTTNEAVFCIQFYCTTKRLKRRNRHHIS